MRNVQSAVSLLVSVALAVSGAAGSHLGVVVAHGDLSIDGSKVKGNATLFEGTSIRTTEASADVQLTSGARLRLAPDSSGRVYKERFVLERGALESSGEYTINASGLVMRHSGAAIIHRDAAGRIEVAALDKPVLVSAASGALVANVTAGTKIDIDFAQGASTAAKVSGKVRQENGKFLITDCVANVVSELIGDNLESLVGKTVEVKGTIESSSTAAANTPQLIRVIETRNNPAACAAAGAPGGHKTLITGLVIAAGGGTVATLALAKKDKDKDKKDKVSR